MLNKDNNKKIKIIIITKKHWKTFAEKINYTLVNLR